MSKDPLNLALRFGLELVGLAGLGLWGWSLAGGACSVCRTMAGRRWCACRARRDF